MSYLPYLALRHILPWLQVLNALSLSDAMLASLGQRLLERCTAAESVGLAVGCVLVGQAPRGHKDA